MPFDFVSKYNLRCFRKLLKSYIFLLHLFSCLKEGGSGHDEVIKWKHFPALLAFCAGNSPVTREFPTQRPVTRSFDVFFDLRLNKRLRCHHTHPDVIVMGWVSSDIIIVRHFSLKYEWRKEKIYTLVCQNYRIAVENKVCRHKKCRRQVVNPRH